MTGPGPRSRRPLVLLVLAALAIVAALGGAYLDWIWWHPMRAITTTLIAIGLIVVGVVGLLIRVRPVRFVGLGALAVGIGLIAGQVLGPVRELPTQSEGTMHVSLSRPAQVELDLPAMCQTVSTFDNLDVSADDMGALTLEDGTHSMMIRVTIGDMWPSSTPRDDRLSVDVIVSPVAIAADGFPVETRMASNSASDLQATVGQLDGSIAFDRLALAAGSSAGTAPIDVAGRVDWTCEMPRFSLERR